MKTLIILSLIQFSILSSLTADGNLPTAAEVDIGLVFDAQCHQEVQDAFIDMGQAEAKYRDTWWYFSFEGAGQNMRLQMRRKMAASDEVFMESLETYKDGICMTFNPGVGRIVMIRNADKPWSGAGMSKAFGLFYNRNCIFDAYRWTLPLSGSFKASFPVESIFRNVSKMSIDKDRFVISGLDPDTHKRGKYTIEFDLEKKWPKKWTFETDDKSQKYEYQVLEWGSEKFQDIEFPFPKRASVLAYYDPKASAKYVHTITWTTEITNISQISEPTAARFVIDPRMARAIFDTDTSQRIPLGVPQESVE